MTNTGGRILVVDDEPPLLKMVSAYLGRLGYEVVPADSAEKAWAEIASAPEPFAVALLDATMGGMGAAGLPAQMMAADQCLCVIVASGYPVDMTVLQAAAPGRVMFLHKPFSPEMLADAVRRMLATQEKGV